jgi:hypothetical protein
MPLSAPSRPTSSSEVAGFATRTTPSRAGPFGRTKISSSDPHLMSIRTAYATPPLLLLLDPVIAASCRPRRRFHLDRRLDLTAADRATELAGSATCCLR